MIMSANATMIRETLRAAGLRTCPAYGPEGLFVADRGDVVLVRAIGPAQTMLAAAARASLEHAGFAVDDAPPSKWDVVYTNMIIPTDDTEH